MPYERSTFVIEPKGLELAGAQNFGPGSLVLKNFRPDSSNALRVRPGHSLVYPGALADVVHTLFLSRNPNNRYQGVGTEVYRDGVSADTGYDGSPLYPENLDGFVWLINRSKQRKDDGTTFSDASPTIPAVAPTLADIGAGPITGTLIYFYTWVNADGHESGASPFTVIADLVDKTVRVTIPALPLGYTKAYIYRNGGGFNDGPLRVGETATTTFDDDVENVEVQALPIQLELTIAAAPAARGAIFHMGGLMAWSTAAEPGTLFLSIPDRPWAWRVQDKQLVGDGNDILVCTSKGNVLLVYKPASVWRIVGDLRTGLGASIECVSKAVGLSGPKAIASDGQFDYFLSRSGVYRLHAGGTPEKISWALDPIFDGRPPDATFNQVLPGINLSAIEATVLEVFNDVLYVSYPSGISSAPNITACLHLPSGRWFQDSRAFSALCFEGADRGFIAARSGANEVVFLDSGDTDDGDIINGVLLTKYLDFGFPNNPKRLIQVRVQHNTRGNAFSVIAHYDNDTVASDTLGTLNSSDQTTSILKFSDDGKIATNIAVELNGTTDDQGVALYQIEVEYEVQPRFLTLLSCSIEDFESELVKEAREIHLELFPTADITARVFSDGAFGQLTEVDNWIIPAAGNGMRKIHPRLFATRPVGRRWRIRLESAGVFQCWSARIAVRPLPIYLGGGSNIWRPGALSLAA